ncbi:MAG: hypothetical protein V3V49_03000 [Candidatus Krumholzibacteria bacterium]
MTSEAGSHFDRLISEVQSLTSPRVLGDFIQDAAGLFIPGCAALPAVSIVSSQSWKTRTRPNAERWRTGDLVALRSRTDTNTDGDPQAVFFTPIGDITIPLIDITPGKQSSRFEKSLDLRLKDRWEKSVISFAFLPWDAEREGRGWHASELLEISRVLELYARRLEVFLQFNNHEIPLSPDWAGPSWVASPSVAGIRFPLNYASKLISPFIFKLVMEPYHTLPDGRKLEIESETVSLRFRFPEDALRDLYQEAGLGNPDLSGISIFGNALPVMNVDLKAWELDDSFAECVSTAGMKPLGAAGIFPYRKAGNKNDQRIEPVESYANLFTLEIDRGGTTLTNYDLPGEKNTKKTKQLFLWMTHGSEVNDAEYSYHATTIIQPMQKTSILLEQASTVMACFGGYDCPRSKDKDWYNKLMLTYSTPPQTLVYRDSLLHIIGDLVEKLGYEDVEIENPVTELRVVDGARRRVTVVYLQSKRGKPLTKGHVETIQSFVDDRSPVGSQVVLQVR